MKYTTLLFLIIYLLVSCNSPKSVDKNELIDYHTTETPEEQKNRMQWWIDAGFGMFIHWGLYSIPAGKYKDQNNHAEWIQETANIPVEEYEKYAALFNPVNYNAEDWVRMAKDAGMKYIVITSKHHDGFCLWDSKVSDYDIIDRTPYKKDLLKELADACKKEGIVLCFYHSIMDWHHPQAQGINYPDYNNGTGPNPEFPSYVENYLYPQLEELMSNYGKLGVMWFDGEWIAEWSEELGVAVYNHLRNMQPDLIINNRVGKGRKGMQGMNAYQNAAGDFGTPEQEIIEGTSDLDWESCMTMNDHWGFNQFDNNFKSTEMLIHNLLDIAAKGGNYLLNVGPKADGTFPEESVIRLREIGDWMKINGEVIHNSRGCKHFKEGEHIYYIQSNDSEYLYAVLTKWPGTTVRLKYSVPESGTKIFLLGHDEKLNWQDQGENGIIIELPSSWQTAENRPVNHAFVIKMEGKQALVAESPEISIQGKKIGNKSLFADKSIIELSSQTKDADIFYTLDGSEPGPQSTNYSKAIEIDRSTVLKAIAVKENYVNSPEIRAEFIQSLNYKEVDFKYPFSSKYAALGKLSIADGVFGNIGDYSRNWLGFEGEDMIATIDLGELKSIDEVKINFLEDIKSWIFLPDFLEVRVSPDGENYLLLDRIDIEMPKAEGKSKSHLFTSSFSKEQARYIRVTAKNIGICPEWHPGAGGKAWLFVDEIMVE